MEEKNNKIFEDFTINDLFKKIYLNHIAKEKKISDLSEELRLFMVDSATAMIIAPTVKDLTDVGIKNDELLIKLANVASKLVDDPNKKQIGYDDIIPLSKEEKNDLIQRMKDITISIENG